MPGDPQDMCRLCLTANRFTLEQPAVECFGTASATKYTVAEVLNLHFWFELRIDCDASAFVCQPCWLKTEDFHKFYQSVQVLHQQHFKPTDALSPDEFSGDQQPIIELLADTQNHPDGDDCDDDDAYASRLQSDGDAEEEDDKVLIFSDANKMESSAKEIDSDPHTPPKRKRGRPRRRFDHAEVAAVTVDVHLDDEQTPADADDDTSSPGQHQCDDCDKTYTSAKWLASHRAAKHAGDECQPTGGDGAVSQRRIDDELMCRYMSMVCGECGATYKSFADAKRHYRTAHRQAGYVECCDRKFSTKDRAVQHCRWHENPQQYDCTICGQNFQNTRSLQDHLERKHPSPTAFGFQCDQCERHYTQLSQLRNHMRRVHTPHDQRRFECFHCHRRYAYLSSLRSHMPSHDPEPSHVCDVCAKLFKSRQTYELHYALEHGTVSLKRQCPVCQRWLKHANMLSRHMFLHRDNPITCADCGHRAPNDRAMYEHRRKRHREPTHQCMACGKWFKRLHTLREHMAIHAGITDLYTCAYCPKTFRSDSNMYKHRRKVHAAQFEVDRRAVELATEKRNVEEAAAAAAIRTRLGLKSTLLN